MKKNNKITLTVSSLIIALGLSGCSFDLIKTDKSDNSISVINEYGYETEMSDNNVDKIMSFPDEKEEFEEVKDYSYLVEKTEYTNATLAHVISEKTIVSNSKKLLDLKKFFDGKKELNYEYFENPVIQPITLPMKYPLFGIEDLSELVECYGTCEITGKKLLTLDGETLYYFDSVFTFNHMSERLGFGFEEGDTIEASCMYRLNDLGQWEQLYRKQSGKDYDTQNVLDANFNSYQKILVPIEETEFADMIGEEYTVDFIIDELNAYNDANNYYGENDSQKVSQLIKY